MKANFLLKHNIDSLLRARHQRRVDLAQWCRRTPAWLSKIFQEDRREIPLKYLDRIADFFGIATYQLFQPGISPLTERRKSQDRRTGRDRRLSRVTLNAAPTDLSKAEIGIVAMLRAVHLRDRVEFEKLLDEVYRLSAKGAGASTAQASDAPGSIAGTAAPRQRRRAR